MDSSSATGSAGSTVLHEGPLRGAVVGGVLTLIGLIAAALVLQAVADLPGRYVLVVGACFGLVLIAVWAWVPGHHPHRRFGAANQMTLVRTALATLLLGCVGAGAEPLLGWLVVGVAGLAASLDAVDGPLARWQGTASDFGARFDMEADAGFVMVLSVLVWQFDKAGIWVLASGLMRYVFWGAGVLWPWLGGTLPPSFRRKAVCVIQVVVLIVCLAPVVPASWSTVVAALGLAALAGSFLIDIAWLVRHRRRAP